MYILLNIYPVQILLPSNNVIKIYLSNEAPFLLKK